MKKILASVILASVFIVGCGKQVPNIDPTIDRELARASALITQAETVLARAHETGAKVFATGLVPANVQAEIKEYEAKANEVIAKAKANLPTTAELRAKLAAVVSEQLGKLSERLRASGNAQLVSVADWLDTAVALIGLAG